MKFMSAGARAWDPASDPEGPRAFSQSRILASDQDGAATPLFPSDEPVLTSAAIAWAGLLVEQHHLLSVEFPERTVKAHLITVHLRPATLELSLGGKSQVRRMTRGSIDIIPRGTRLGGYSPDETEFLMLALDPALVERMASESGAAMPVELNRNLGIRDPQIEHICLAIKAELETGCPAGRPYGNALAVALAAHLLGKYRAQQPAAPVHSAVLPAYKLRRVTEYIKANLTKDLTLGELAELAGMNPHHFSRAFKQSTGIPPHRYVVNCRVEEAKRLLTEDELPLAEVGLCVGFQNQSHFTTLFHKLTGLTPKAYRDGN